MRKRDWGWTCYGNKEADGCCQPCEVTSDCNYAPGLVCEYDVGRFMPNRTAATDGRGCTCYAFFGFHGNTTCLDNSIGAANFVKTVGLVMYLICGVLVVYNMYNCFYIIAKFIKAKRFKLSKSPIQTVVFLAVALPGFAVWTIGYILTYARLDNSLVFERDIKSIVIAIGGGFGMMGILNISIMWMNMASRSKTHRALVKGDCGAYQGC